MENVGRADRNERRSDATPRPNATLFESRSEKSGENVERSKTPLDVRDRLFEIDFEVFVLFLDFDFFNVRAGMTVFRDHFGVFFRNRIDFRVVVPVNLDLARSGFDAFLRRGVNSFELAAFLDVAETRTAAVDRDELDAETGRDRLALVGRDAGNRDEFVRGFRTATANGDDGGGSEGR